MQLAMEESEARIEQRVEHMMDQKVQAVHKHLDAFELRVLERPTPTVDLTILQKKIENLRADITGLLVTPETEPESESARMAPVDNTVVTALFSDDMLPPDSSCATGKRPRSGRTCAIVEAERARKRERQSYEVARRASIVDEEMRQQRAWEIGTGQSSGVRTTDGAVRVYMITTEGAVRVDERTTKGAERVDGRDNDGVPHVDPAGSVKPNPPTS
uniref:Integrase core domain containing protein n=1 Tax=Solanum tuberosum TaxID=4113 RepID=M1DK06_SOLTU